MVVEGKGPVRSWIGALIGYRHVGGMATRIPREIPLKGKGEVPAGKPGPRTIVMGPDNLLPAPVKFEANRPVGLRIEIKDLPKPGEPDGEQIGPFAVTSSDPAWGSLFREGSMRQILASQSFAAGVLTEDAQLSQPRNDLPVTPRDDQYDAWPAGYRIIDSSITFTRGERLLAMVMKVLRFDITAWLREMRGK